MRFLPVGAGAGALSGGAGVYVSFFDANTSALTLVVYRPPGSSPESATFTLRGPAAGISSLHAVRSSIVADGHPQPPLGGYFLLQPDVPVAGGAFSLPLAPGDMWTLTTLGGLTKGAHPLPPAASAFPSAYTDSFDACPENSEAPYWTDMTGVFECHPAPGRSGMAMRQSAAQHPVAWRPEEQRPFSLFAGDIAWVDAATSLDVALSAPGDSAMLGLRANPNCCGRVITGEDLMPGAWLWWDTSGGWVLYNAVANVTSAATGVLARGAWPGGLKPAPGAWHTVRMALQSGQLTASIDGTPALNVTVPAGAVPEEGFVGMGTGAWGQYVFFDNFEAEKI